MRNKIFQFLYYKIFERLIPVIKTENPLMMYIKKFKFQYSLAKFFGGAKLALIGDSNFDGFSEYKNMKKFDEVTIAITKGGITVEDLLDFINETRGWKFFSKIKCFDIILNIGGNNCLQNKMENVRESLMSLREYFDKSWACTIPPVYSFALDLLDDGTLFDKSKEDYEREIAEINKYIKETWTWQAIDLYQLFLDMNTGNVYLSVLKDPVHFADCAVAIIRKIIKGVS